MYSEPVLKAWVTNFQIGKSGKSPENINNKSEKMVILRIHINIQVPARHVTKLENKINVFV